MLLSQPPPWLISPTPWLIYPLIYTLLIPTGLSSYIITTCPPLIFNTFGAYVDGIIRGTTIASLRSAIASSGLKTSWLTPVLLSGIAVSSSGWLVTGLSMHESDWSLGKPSVLNGGALDTMDLWGGMLVGLVNAALMRSHAELAPLSGILLRALPSDMQTVGASSGSKPVVTPAIGRAICVLLLGSLLCARVIAKAVLDYRKSCKTKMKKAKKTPATTTVTTKEVLREKPREEVLKSPAKTEKRGTTPRKSPRPKKT